MYYYYVLYVLSKLLTVSQHTNCKTNSKVRVMSANKLSSSPRAFHLTASSTHTIVKTWSQFNHQAIGDNVQVSCHTQDVKSRKSLALVVILKLSFIEVCYLTIINLFFVHSIPQKFLKRIIILLHYYSYYILLLLSIAGCIFVMWTVSGKTFRLIATWIRTFESTCPSSIQVYVQLLCFTFHRMDSFWEGLSSFIKHRHYKEYFSSILVHLFYFDHYFLESIIISCLIRVWTWITVYRFILSATHATVSRWNSHAAAVTE